MKTPLVFFFKYFGLVTLVSLPSLGQTNYEPYAFITLAGAASSSGTNDGVGNASRFNSPRGLGVDTHANVFVADYNNHTIRKITPAGNVTTIAGLGGVPGTNDGVGSIARFNGPRRVVADAGNHTIRKIVAGGTNWIVTTLAGLPAISGSVDGTNSDARFKLPSGVALDASENIYVADDQNHTIRKLVLAGTNCVVTTIAGLSGSSGSTDGTNNMARFHGPLNVDADEAGNIFVADSDNNMIRKIVPEGTNWIVVTVAGSTNSGFNDALGTSALFNNPIGIISDNRGNLFIGDTFNNVIRKIGPNGLVTTLAGLPESAGSEDGTGNGARFRNPRGVTTDRFGNIYVADAGNNSVRKGWAVGTPPVIVLDAPTMLNGDAQLNFTVMTGSVTAFTLLEATEILGPWTTNSIASLTTNIAGVSYSFTVPTSGGSRFYRVRTDVPTLLWD